MLDSLFSPLSLWCSRAIFSAPLLHLSGCKVDENGCKMQFIPVVLGARKQVETACDSEMLSREAAAVVSAIVVCVFHCLGDDLKTYSYNVIGCGIVHADTFVAMLPIVIQAREEVVPRDNIDAFFD